MRYITFLLLGAVLFTGACRKSKLTGAIPAGTYSGTFQRTGGPVANVVISFSASGWTGRSDAEHYPALCEGRYTTNGNNASFECTCFWTANFDWSLILHGEYTFSVNGSRLEISKVYNNGVTDSYQLTRQ